MEGDRPALQNRKQPTLAWDPTHSLNPSRLCIRGAGAVGHGSGVATHKFDYCLVVRLRLGRFSSGTQT
jgi:hypothetical protein